MPNAPTRAIATTMGATTEPSIPDVVGLKSGPSVGEPVGRLAEGGGLGDVDGDADGWSDGDAVRDGGGDGDGAAMISNAYVSRAISLSSVE